MVGDVCVLRACAAMVCVCGHVCVCGGGGGVRVGVCIFFFSDVGAFRHRMASEFSPSGQRLTPELLAKLLVAQHEAFTVLAGGKVSQVHSEVERLKEQYLRVVNDYAQAGACSVLVLVGGISGSATPPSLFMLHQLAALEPDRDRCVKIPSVTKIV